MIGNTQNVPVNSGGGKNGLEVFKLVTETGINLVYINPAPVSVYSITCIGITSEICYLKLYNKASAMNPDIHSPLLLIPIPANTQGAGVTISFPIGVDFSEGLTCLVVKGIDDTDKTSVVGGSAIINLTYK
jgi:hypothetical protein